MSDKREQLNLSSGRWDHLLKEIPNKAPSAEPRVIEEPVPEPIPQTQEEPILSVSEINREVKRQLEGKFGHIWVQGEISNFKAHSSGHHYFSLKDEKAQINAVMFRGFNSKLKFRPESGMEVLIRGKITVYEPRGNYQIFCEHMEPVGAGALQKAFEQLKTKLQKEGLFDQDRKQALPEFPKKIGVVTSPTGAAVRDILNVLKRRCKRAEVVVIPARVQGDLAAREVVSAIELANKVQGFDVLIVGRGGGSIEDLWCFNEEIVARAIAQSEIPIISAVGHEVDFTIADFVADLRAPTPSAAAEVVAKSEQELGERLKFYSKSLRILVYQALEQKRSSLKMAYTGLIDPRKYLQDCMLRCDEWTQRLQLSMKNQMRQRKLELNSLSQRIPSPQSLIEKQKVYFQSQWKLLNLRWKNIYDGKKNSWVMNTGLLDSLSPLKVVDRGYALVRNDEGELVSSVKKMNVGDALSVELKDGKAITKVEKIEKKGKS